VLTRAARIERRGDLRRLLALLAGRSGGLLVPATLATASGIPRTTLNRCLELLYAVFLIKQIPAWSTARPSALSALPSWASSIPALPRTFSARTPPGYRD